VHQAALGKPLVRLLKRLLEDGSRPGEVLLVMEDLKDMGQYSWDTESDDSRTTFTQSFSTRMPGKAKRKQKKADFPKPATSSVMVPQSPTAIVKNSNTGDYVQS
jgi:hypothetical protein